MNKIIVKIPGNTYPVIIGSGVFEKLSLYIEKERLNKNIFIVIDENVYSLFEERVNQFIVSTESKTYLYSFVANESNKSLSVLSDIHSALLNNGFGRDTLIIAIGGGITGDIASYAASTFMRGVQIVHIPTTLLAMVDSSVGGKTGINFGATKNSIGSFYQPRFVLTDVDFLSTLPKEEIICGIGEIIKYSLLANGMFLKNVKNNLPKIISLDKKLIKTVIKNCVEMKAGIVASDEKEERGLRKILNLGHTFAHSIEMEQKHKIKHGQAVIIGLACSIHLSNKLNILSDRLLAEYLSIIIKLSDLISVKKYNSSALIEIMKRDKKAESDKIKFVLLKEAGKIFVDMEAEQNDIDYAINNGFQYFFGTGKIYCSEKD
jgi:3-dehydroquinate synthase